jgi:aspartyl-tRNA(Asn)/glutamyl-tRNA(Gln) amidotransferase subunit A
MPQNDDCDAQPTAPLPEVSGPTGIGPDGLPSVNPSIVGLPGDDARVLAFAHVYERWACRFTPTPPVAGLGRNEPW